MINLKSLCPCSKNPRLNKKETQNLLQMLSLGSELMMNTSSLLEMMAETGSTRKVRATAKNLKSAVENGEGLAKAMHDSQAFGTLYVKAVCFGERSGQLPKVADALQSALKEEIRLSPPVAAACHVGAGIVAGLVLGFILARKVR